MCSAPLYFGVSSWKKLLQSATEDKKKRRYPLLQPVSDTDPSPAALYYQTSRSYRRMAITAFDMGTLETQGIVLFIVLPSCSPYGATLVAGDCLSVDANGNHKRSNKKRQTKQTYSTVIRLAQQPDSCRCPNSELHGIFGALRIFYNYVTDPLTVPRRKGLTTGDSAFLIVPYHRGIPSTKKKNEADVTALVVL